ncbi:L,D-transpeptidase [Methylobacterium sp. E-041]|uniref:L,D-transpeptidase n=1 Tax=unclassified Methylobacterium TaxID=2615210 RepID=UPI001FBB1B24|nr:L,D-transpeptidase [Methylobacterium sp. E-041]MCJ2108438.1 L,D-transpeptidase [Methylobacterium sp. E-041]
MSVRKYVSTSLGGALLAGLVAGAPALAREVVPFSDGVMPGSVVISVSQRRLYLVNGDGTAIRYPVAVGKPGKQWFGTKSIDGKYVQPAWSPPSEVKRDNPRLPNLIAGGSPHNPMGAAAMTLSGGEYAIHGTNRPSSVGTWASYGCIRMYNQDVVDLYDRVSVGTPVYVTR